MRNDFAEWLKREREARGLSQSELARLSYVHRSVINKAESGTSPLPETLQAIAQGLKLPKEIVYRAAGILLPVAESTAQKDNLNYLFDSLSKEGKDDLVSYARFLLEKQARSS